MAQKSYPTQGKGRRPIIGYDNEKFRANYDSIFKKNENQKPKISRELAKENILAQLSNDKDKHNLKLFVHAYNK